MYYTSNHKLQTQDLQTSEQNIGLTPRSPSPAYNRKSNWKAGTFGTGISNVNTFNTNTSTKVTSSLLERDFKTGPVLRMIAKNADEANSYIERVIALTSSMPTSESTFQIIKNSNNAKHLSTEVINLINDLDMEVDSYIKREVDRITST